MRIAVHVVPNASRDRIESLTETGEYRIRIQSPPVEGAANRGLIRFLAKTFGVSKSRISIVRGETGRHKLIEIDGDDDEIISILENMVS